MERSCDFIRDSKGTDRHTAGKTFRKRHNIGFYAVFLIGEERPRAPDSRLNLIEDEERTMLVAEGTNLFQIVVLRRIDAPLPLNRLEHDRCRLIADLRLEICNIIVADIVKACRQRAKSLVILRLPRCSQGRKRTPVKAIPRREDLRFLGMDLAGVLTCNLYRPLICLCSRVAEEYFAEPAKCCKFFRCIRLRLRVVEVRGMNNPCCL